MAYRDGASLSQVIGNYDYKTVEGMPVLMGGSQASAQAIKAYINNCFFVLQLSV
jgi:hypothetical protein